MMVFRRVVIRGVAEIGEVDVAGPIDPGFGRPGGGHPDQGLPGYGHPDQGLPGYGHPDHDLPGRPPRPDQGLPGYGHPDHDLPGRRPRPDQGLPGYGHPDQGLPGYGHPDQGLPGLPVYPSQGPILPAAPGQPIPVPRVPVVQVIPLPEGAVLPTEPPHRPGRIAIVVDGDVKAVGWLQGSDDLPVATPKGEAPVVGGHWVAVEVYPQAQPKKCNDGSDGVGKTGFAWVFEIDKDFGTKPTPV
jgi:hypothetical protein